MTRPEPVFQEPWHAQLFALTVYLNEKGHFDWPDWAASFSEVLKRHGLRKELNGGDDYFQAWLATLEAFLEERELTNAGDVAELKRAWEQAYLSTPHGDPVRLSD